MQTHVYRVYYEMCMCMPMDSNRMHGMCSAVQKTAYGPVFCVQAS